VRDNRSRHFGRNGVVIRRNGEVAQRQSLWGPAKISTRAHPTQPRTPTPRENLNPQTPKPPNPQTPKPPNPQTPKPPNPENPQTAKPPNLAPQGSASSRCKETPKHTCSEALARMQQQERYVTTRKENIRVRRLWRAWILV
jgi:hypothetical protein